MRRGHPAQAVLFDLDGTLVQTRLASWEIFRPISERFRLGIVDADQFYRLFEQNVYAALRTLCRSEREAAEVEEEFLRRLREDYTPAMIPGMADVVRALAPHCTLAVLSSNATAVVRRILLANDLAYCFGHVFGGDVEPDKARGIARFLADAAHGCGRHCAVAYDEAGARPHADKDGVVLVTDTVGDVRAAATAGIRSIGVTWGMHSEAELLDAGAEFVAIWPQELLPHLLDGSMTEETGCAALRPPGPVPPGNFAIRQARATEIRRGRRIQHPRRPPASALAERPRPAPLVVDDRLREAVRQILPPRSVTGR